MNDVGYGLWAGLGVDNTAEATAAGALYSDAAGKVAVLAKTARNAMIGFVVLATPSTGPGGARLRQLLIKRRFCGGSSQNLFWVFYLCRCSSAFTCSASPRLRRLEIFPSGLSC